jgi:MoaA/NifB/PqqE/SkfB family radical SAM enzyme
MSILRTVARVFDSKPWAAHLYVTEQCNLDCHYCNEFNNSIPHPSVANLQKWMTKIRELGVARLGLQGGEPLKHPEIVELVRFAKSLGFHPVSMSTNGFLLTRPLLAELEAAGLDSIHISVDRMTPIASTRKSMKSILPKLDWFKDSKIKLNVSAVLFKETLEEMGEVIDTCLDRGVAVQARAVHDDLVHNRVLREPGSIDPLLGFIEQEERLKRRGEKIHTCWNLFDYQKAMLRRDPVDWTCTAGYKYFFVSSTGRFWLCSQVRTDRHIMDITPADLRAYNQKKDCQSRCGVYCTVTTSLLVNHPFRFMAREAGAELSRRFQRERTNGPKRFRELSPTD